MKTLISILLIAAFLGIHMNQTFTFLIFKVNQEYIANTLCVDKEVEQSSCQGSCYLKEQLDESNPEEDSGFPAVLESEQFLRVAVSPLNQIYKLSEKPDNTLAFIDLKNLYKYLSPTDIFHPPIV